MDKKKEKKRDFKCLQCQFYDKPKDYCFTKEIEGCSKKPPTEFSQCSEFLISEKLVMF